MTIKTLQYKMPQEIEGILVKISPRAKKMKMSFDTRINDIILSKPKRISKKAVEEFINKNRDWIAEVRRTHKVDNKFIEGSVINVYGHDYQIVRKDSRGSAYIEEDKIIIYANAENLPRKLKDFLKKYASEKIALHVAEKIKIIRWYKMPQFRIADPKSRWGSCTSDGRLMFSWRLILAPVEVLDYIVAHEVAHLEYMDHSPKFWNLCYSLTADALNAKIWIKRNGNTLMGYR